MFRMTVTSTFDEAKTRAIVRARRLADVRRAAEHLEARVRARAPRDTGRLVASIRVVPGSGDEGWRVVVAVPYAGFVEFGHRTPAGGFVPPNPYLRESAAETRRAFPGVKIVVLARMPARR